MMNRNASISVREFIESIIRFSVAPIVNFFIGFFSVVILTRIFSPDVYGILNIFSQTANLIMGIVSLGMGDMFIRYFSKPPAGWSVQQLLCKSMLIGIIGWGVLGTFCIVFYKNISEKIFNEVSFYWIILLLISALALLVLNRFLANYYRVMNDSWNYSIQQVAVNFITKIFVMFSFFIGCTADNVLTLYAFGLVGLMIGCVFLAKGVLQPEYFSFSYKKAGEAIKFGLWSWPGYILINLNSFIIPYVVVVELGTYSLGIYSSAGIFCTVASVVSTGFCQYWSPFMYKYFKTEQKKIITVHNYVLLGILLMLGMFIVLQNLAYMFIGLEYQSSRKFFSLLVCDVLFIVWGETVAYGIPLMKRVWESVIISVFTLILNVVLSILLMKYCNILGVAIACATVAAIKFFLLAWRGQKYYKSIYSFSQTFFGAVLILFFAVSNVIFNDDYYSELVALVVGYFIAAIVYRKDFRCIYIIICERFNTKIKGKL